MDDEELHERIILLDVDAIREWQARHSGLIVGWLAKRGIGVPDAEEIWNDVLSATVEAAPRLNPRAGRGDAGRTSAEHARAPARTIDRELGSHVASSRFGPTASSRPWCRVAGRVARAQMRP